MASHLIFVFDRTKTSTGLNHDHDLNSKVKLFSERTVHNFSKKNLNFHQLELHRYRSIFVWEQAYLTKIKEKEQFLKKVVKNIHFSYF
jgi:hypothetical protein